jgi:ribosome recycling factor
LDGLKPIFASIIACSILSIRVGKANPQMLRSVSLDYYGVISPLSQASNISTPDAQTLLIQPFDTTLIDKIEQAIIEAKIGFNPSNNGEKIIITIPPLTEERRKELVKQVKVESENAKISVRNIRQKANDEMKKLGKQGLSEDLERNAQNLVQDLTNAYIEKVERIISIKESEIMKV